MHSKQKGFSLIEALITMVILSFGFLALTKFESSLLSNQSISVNRTEGQMYAQQALSYIEASGNPAGYASGSDVVKGKNAQYTRSWNVQEGVAGETLAVVTATWTDAKGVLGRVVLSSVMAKDVALNEAGLALHPNSIFGDTANSNPPWTTTTSGTAPYVATTPPSPSPTSTPAPPPTLATTPGAHKISGIITYQAGATAANITISGTNAAGCAVSLNTYSCSVPNAWSGTIITVTNGGFSATPGSVAYSNVIADIGSQDYVVN